jgi:hypothetical protein
VVNKEIEDKVFDTLNNTIDIITKTMQNMNYALERAEKRISWYKILIIICIISLIAIIISYNIRDAMIARSYFNQTYESSISDQNSLIQQKIGKGE